MVIIHYMKDAVQQKSTRDAILDATDRLLARHGYKKMTIDDLAREVGIGKGSVYLHFSSKEEIALTHIDRIIERLKARLRTIASKETPCEDRVREMLIERVLFRFDSVQHYTQSLNDLLSHLRPRLLDRRKRHFEEEVRIFAKILDAGSTAGEFSFKDPASAARALLDATNAFLPYSLSVSELGERAEIERKINSVADLLLAGLVKR